MNLMKGKAGAVETDTLYWYIFAVVVLFIVLGGYFVLSGKGQAAIDFFKNMVRFR